MALFALLSFGTFWFWAAAILPFLLLIALVENEKSGWALATTIITIGALIAFGNQGVLGWIVQHPLQLIALIIGYLVVGIGWGIAKWGFYGASRLAKYETFRAEWIAANGIITDEKPVEDARSPGMAAKQTAESSRTRFTRAAQSAKVGRPDLAKNRGRILFWMSYWPASAIWTLLNDPITHFYRFIYAKLIVVFEGISDAMFKKYKDDFAA